MTDPANTRPQDLLRAIEIGKAGRAALRPTRAILRGEWESFEDTRCHPTAPATLIKRYSYVIEDYRITSRRNLSLVWGLPSPGRWASKFGGQITAQPFLPRRASRFGYNRRSTINLDNRHPRTDAKILSHRLPLYVFSVRALRAIFLTRRFGRRPSLAGSDTFTVPQQFLLHTGPVF